MPREAPPERPANPVVGQGPPERHPFTSTFLILFLLDGVLGVIFGVLYLWDPALINPEKVEAFAAPFGLALLMGALIQVSLSITRRMRWSARVLGLFVVGTWLAQLGVLLIYALFLVATRGAEPLGAEPPPLPDVLIGAMSLGISGLEIGVGIWAARDLAGGHYQEAVS